MVKNGKENAVFRIIVLVILIINQVLIILGHDPLPYDENQIYEFVSTLGLAIFAIYSSYKNNNLTQEALAGQGELERLKKARRK